MYAKSSEKSNISNSLIRKRKCAYQGVRNVSFSKNFAYELNEWFQADFPLNLFFLYNTSTKRWSLRIQSSSLAILIGEIAEALHTILYFKGDFSWRLIKNINNHVETLIINGNSINICFHIPFLIVFIRNINFNQIAWCWSFIYYLWFQNQTAQLSEHFLYFIRHKRNHWDVCFKTH